MAYDFNGTSQYLERTANLPPTSGWTMCAWVQVGSAQTWGLALSYGNTGGGATPRCGVGWSNSNWNCYANNGAGGTEASLGTDPAAGDIIFLAITGNGTATYGYRRNINATTLTQSSSAGAITGTVNSMRVGNSVYDGTDYFDGAVWNVKVWDRVLTAAELLIESYYSQPKFPSSLNLWTPLAADASDRSGNGRNWTATGSPPLIQGSQGLWKPKIQVFYSSSSAVTGTLNKTNANDTSSASGTTTVVGTLSRTNSNDTSSASGTTTIVGTLAKTNNNDTSAASGSPIIVGTLSRTNANDTLSASGSVGDPVSGTVNVTNANDTSSASGTTTVTGTLAKTNSNDTSNASGTTTVVGTLAKTNTNDTLAASGSSGSDVSGTVNYTNVNDSSSASGTTTVVGTVAKTNNNDSVVASGTTTVVGTINRTNTNDSISAFGVVGNVGTANTRLPLTGAGT